MYDNALRALDGGAHRVQLKRQEMMNNGWKSTYRLRQKDDKNS
jgi:hypothetical protein